mgnify:CR=1 FL=1
MKTTADILRDMVTVQQGESILAFLTADEARALAQQLLKCAQAVKPYNHVSNPVPRDAQDTGPSPMYTPAQVRFPATPDPGPYNSDNKLY